MAKKKLIEAEFVTPQIISTPTAIPALVRTQAEARSAAIAAKVDKLAAIRTQHDYDAADAFRSGVIKPAIDYITEGDADAGIPGTKRIKSAAYALWKSICDQESGMLRPFQTADLKIKAGMERYQLEERGRQQAEQRRLEAASKLAAEEAAIEEASMLLADGNEAAGRELLQQVERGEVEASVVLPAMKMESIGAQNSTTRWPWKYRLVDVTKLKPEFLLPDDKAIQAKVTKLGKAAEEVVGRGSIEAFQAPNVATRRS